LRENLLLALVLPALPAVAVIPSDLADLVRQIEHFPSSGDARARLKQFFDLYWAAAMPARPDLAVYVGYTGLEGRQIDLSPELTALPYRLPRLELAALDSIERAKLTLPEQLNYDLARAEKELGPKVDVRTFTTRSSAWGSCRWTCWRRGCGDGWRRYVRT
jgi:hypothetical protein